MPKREIPLTGQKLKLHIASLVFRNLEQCHPAMALEVLDFVRPDVERRKAAAEKSGSIEDLFPPEASPEERTLPLPGVK